MTILRPYIYRHTPYRPPPLYQGLTIPRMCELQLLGVLGGYIFNLFINSIHTPPATIIIKGVNTAATTFINITVIMFIIFIYTTIYETTITPHLPTPKARQPRATDSISYFYQVILKLSNII